MKVLCSQEVVRPHRCSCPMSGHCKGVCIPDTMVCALVRGFPREVRRGWQSQKPLIFMHFHEVFLGSQHEIWSKQHNGKVSDFDVITDLRVCCMCQYDAALAFRKLTHGYPGGQPIYWKSSCLGECRSAIAK